MYDMSENDAPVNPTLPEDTLYDPWHWLAVGVEPDGVTAWQMHEYEPDTGVHRSFAAALEHLGAISKLVLLPAYPQRYPNLQPVVVLVPQGARAVFARRRSVVAVLDPDAPVPEPNARITFAGLSVNGSDEYLVALFDDGSAILTSDRNAL